MWLTITLSFGFYIPVVLWADTIPLIGHADDPQDLCLCMDCIHRLSCHEERVPVKEVPINENADTNCALLYSVLAMAGGVFYREFTKLNAFTGKTTLSVVHTHYFLLGMVVFLLLLLLEKNFSFTGSGTGKVLAVYHTGLNLTALMFVVRGITQVLGSPLTSGMDAAISGMAGIGHILLGISLVLLLLQIRRSLPAL